MADFYCPYLGKMVAAHLGSEEHVVPRSLGGSDDLCVQVETNANKRLGADVDAPTIQLYAHRRVEFDLRGHSGKEPELKLDVTVGGERGTLELRLNGGGVRLKPNVAKTPQPDGTTHVRISGEPAEARRLAESLRAGNESKGRSVAPFVETATVMEQPEVVGTFQYDLFALGRFTVKLAIGICHWLWGEAWSRGAGASQLRRALWSTTVDELNSVMPSSPTYSPEDMRIKTNDHEHWFVVIPGQQGSVALALFLFGQPGYLLLVSEPQDPPQPDITAVIVDVTNRTVRRLSLQELIDEGRMGGRDPHS